MNFLKKNILGILLCAAIALPATYLGKLLPVVGGPVFAILIGMVIALFLKRREPFDLGVKFTSKYILQTAVVLLGFGLNISTILVKGKESLVVIVVTISTALITAFVFGKLFKVEKKVGTLVGIGSCICGGSAIAASAPVIDANDEEIAQSISVIFLFNVIAALIFPALGGWLGLSNEGFGLFAGTAVNDTSSVTATACAWDQLHNTGTAVLNDATIVKLTRTLAIIPITLVLSFITMHQQKKALALETGEKNSSQKVKSTFKISKIFPMFILYFIIASLITTVFNLSPATTAPIKEASKFFIVMAMGAIGLNTNIIKLFKTGGKPILLGFICWINIAVASLLMQKVIGLW